MDAGHVLLHDIGTGDGIEQAEALGEEIRTPALWGLRFRKPLLHDGSAATAEEALLRHGGEARGTIDNYRRISGEERRQLLAFLDAL